MEPAIMGHQGVRAQAGEIEVQLRNHLVGIRIGQNRFRRTAVERAIQDQSGHKSLLVMRRYIRDGSLFRENAAAKVGL